MGVIRDDFAQGFLRQNYPVLKLRAYPGSREIIGDALNGKLTAFVLDAQNATYLLSQRNALTAFNPAVRLYTRALRAGVRKGDVGDDPVSENGEFGLELLSKRPLSAPGSGHRAMTWKTSTPRRPRITAKDRLLILDLWSRSRLPATEFARLVIP